MIEEVLLERGAHIVRVEVDDGEALPAWQGFDVIVVMGGPMGAYEDEAYPWLAPERALLGAAATGGTPCFGVCLGAQLLAASIGGRAYPGPAPEIGVLEVELTTDGAADPIMSVLPHQFVALQWHGDTFDLPDDAVVLASSSRYARQAFRWRNSIGVQFHAEVTPAMAAQWAETPEYMAYLEAALGPGSPARLLDAFLREVKVINESARLLFERFLGMTVPGS